MTQIEILKELQTVGIGYIGNFVKPDKSRVIMFFDKDCKSISTMLLKTDTMYNIHWGALNDILPGNKILCISKAMEKFQDELEISKDVIVSEDNGTDMIYCPNPKCSYYQYGNSWDSDECPRCGQHTNRY